MQVDLVQLAWLILVLVAFEDLMLGSCYQKLMGQWVEIVHLLASLLADELMTVASENQFVQVLILAYSVVSLVAVLLWADLVPLALVLVAFEGLASYPPGACEGEVESRPAFLKFDYQAWKLPVAHSLDFQA